MLSPIVAYRRYFFLFLRVIPASDMAMAMACLRFVTFLPELDLRVPVLYSDITFSTFFWPLVGFLGAMVGQ